MAHWLARYYLLDNPHLYRSVRLWLPYVAEWQLRHDRKEWRL